MRRFIVLIALCAALWWADGHFFRGQYLQSLQHEGLQLKATFEREIDHILRDISP